MIKTVYAKANEYVGLITEGKAYEVKRVKREFYSIQNDKGVQGLFPQIIFSDELIVKEEVITEKPKKKTKKEVIVEEVEEEKPVQEDINDVEIEVEVQEVIKED